MSARLLAVESRLEREEATKFSRLVSDQLVVNDDITGLADNIDRRTKSLCEIKDEVLETAYMVYLKSCADPEFKAALMDLAKNRKIVARRDTPGATVVAKILFTQNKSSARDHSLLLRAACWAKIEPTALAPDLRARTRVASHLIREFKKAVVPQSSDGTPRPPKLKWDRETLEKLAESQGDGDVLLITAVREGADFAVKEAVLGNGKP
jgi:hypothetical protein